MRKSIENSLYLDNILDCCVCNSQKDMGGMGICELGTEGPECVHVTTGCIRP